MKKLVVSALLFAIFFGVYAAGPSYIYMKNRSIMADLKVECVSADDGITVNVKNKNIKPGQTGIIEISSNQDGKNFEISLATSNLNKTLSLKTEKDYFNNSGFIYNGDYADDPISGDIMENQFYRKSYIEV